MDKKLRSMSSRSPQKRSEAANNPLISRRNAIKSLLIAGSVTLAALGIYKFRPITIEKGGRESTSTVTHKNGFATTSSIANRPPIADFDYLPHYINPIKEQEIQFQDNSIDPEKDTLTYSWYIDDSWRSDEKDFLARLPEGKHEVKLVVSDGRSEDSTSKSVTVDAEDHYPPKKLTIPLKGVNYLIGRRFIDEWGAPPSDLEMDESLEVIRHELGCNAIKLVGDYEDTMLKCAKKCLENNFEEIILSPRYSKRSWNEDTTIDEHVESIIAFSRKAEELRLNYGSITLCIGEELEFGVRGISPAATYGDRIIDLYRRWEDKWEKWEKKMRPYIEERLNFYLRKMLEGVRKHFGGKVTYSASDGTKLLVKWDELGFDIVGPMYYYQKKWETQTSALKNIRLLKTFGKPLYITEFGCFTFKGASFWGGDGWYRYKDQEYSQEEQAQSIREYVDLFQKGKVDGIFLYAFLERTTPDAKSTGILRDGHGRYARKLGFYMYKSFTH
ncbi:MAG: hypothetical protein QW390_02490 [Candidatus Bathyarchaeia archaeon]